MGPLPYQPILLSFFAESCYLDSNVHRKTAPDSPPGAPTAKRTRGELGAAVTSRLSSDQ